MNIKGKKETVSVRPNICRNGKLSLITLAFVIAFPLTSAFATPAEVTNISSRLYFPAVRHALSNAQKSIFVVMYLAGFDPREKSSPVTALVDELVAAHTRGVMVKVILDQNALYPEWANRGEAWVKDDKNETLFTYLKQNGIDVSFDNLFTLTHTKAIVIDEETVILGSTNWTDAALKNNQEASCLIVSKDLAKQFLADFSQIAIDTEAGVTETRPAVKVPDYFIKDASLAPAMISHRDEGAFDMYLLLLRNFDGNPEGRVDVNFKAFSAVLGLDKRYKYESAYDIMSHALHRLDERYHLIRLVNQHPKSPYILLNTGENVGDIFRQGTNDSERKVSPEQYTIPKSNYSPVPDSYWSFGWNKSLSFPEKIFFLINLRKSTLYQTREWSAYRQGIMAEFSLTRNTVIRGIMGLRKLNIVEVEYPPYSQETGFLENKPMTFRLLGLYSPDTLQQEKERLSKLYGAERFQLASKHACSVFKGEDLQVLEDICKKMDEYGADTVSSAFAQVANRSAGNSKRSYNYVVGILQTELKRNELK